MLIIQKNEQLSPEQDLSSGDNALSHSTQSNLYCFFTFHNQGKKQPNCKRNPLFMASEKKTSKVNEELDNYLKNFPIYVDETTINLCRQSHSEPVRKNTNTLLTLTKRLFGFGQ